MFFPFSEVQLRLSVSCVRALTTYDYTGEISPLLYIVCCLYWQRRLASSHVCLSVCLPIYLSIYLSVYLSIYLSIYSKCHVTLNKAPHS
jgi:hypothetical protein